MFKEIWSGKEFDININILICLYVVYVEIVG